jgi:dTMP kinase
MSGRFIVLEGPDGSGTTHHCKRLAETLLSRGIEVLLTAEPTNGPVGSRIREFLREGMLPPDALQLLFCADRAAHVRLDILPALNAGKTVICDRYALSTIAYGEAQGLNPAWLTQLNEPFVKPDLQLLLLPPLSVSLKRLAKRPSQDSMEESGLQERVHRSYARLAAADASMHVIDTSDEKDDVAALILQLVTQDL